MRKEMISNAYAVIHNSGRVCTLWEADANASSLTSGGICIFQNQEWKINLLSKCTSFVIFLYLFVRQYCEVTCIEHHRWTSIYKYELLPPLLSRFVCGQTEIFWV